MSDRPVPKLLRQLLLSGLCLSIIAPGVPAQTGRRQGVESRPAGEAQTPAPATAPAPPGALVYVMQTIDLSQQLGSEENLMTLDGEPLPPMLAKNVTLGLVIDNAGHVITRLVGIGPNSPPQGILVTPQHGRPSKGRLLGLDAATGLCVVEVEAQGFEAPASVSRETPASSPVRLFGFNAAQIQSQSPSMGFARPRIHSFPGRITLALGDFRYQANQPLYRLVNPKLTPVQDGSLVVDNDGAILGIAVHDTTEEGQNLVFPIARVRSIAQAVIHSQGSLAHGWLGASGVTMYAPIARTTKPTASDLGVRIVDVFPDSPAEQAGIRTHDVLLAINDRSIASVEQLSSALRQLSADSEVSLRVKRGNEYKILHAKLVPAPALESGQQLNALASQLRGLEDKLRSLEPMDPQRSTLGPKVTTMRAIMDNILGPAPPEVKLRVRYGLEVEPLTTQLMRYFAVAGGLLITSVGEASQAARSGVRAGDVIVSVGDRQVNDLATLLKALDEGGERPPILAVSRQREQLQMTLAR